MRIEIVRIAAAAWLCCVIPSEAGPWQSRGQAEVASQIGSALANANRCNFGVDTPRVAAVIGERIAPTGQITPDMAADLMFQVVGVQALQNEMLGLDRMNWRELAQHCGSIIKAFGPNGTAISGLLRP